MLKATGNSYHPQCFTCVMCHTPLEGASFIVDQANQPHCVDDYHRYGGNTCMWQAGRFPHICLVFCCTMDLGYSQWSLKMSQQCTVLKLRSFPSFCVTCASVSITSVWWWETCRVVISAVFVCCRKYAPRCSVCSEPIMPEPGKDETVRVVALEKNFHMKCYKCEVTLLAPLLSFASSLSILELSFLDRTLTVS